MKHKTVFWALLFAALAAVSAGVYLLRAPGGTEAVVYVNGEEYQRIDLSAVAVPYEFTIETEDGYNTVRVSHGAIEVIEADCDEQVCVNQGQITDGAVPIVCLPHRIVIQIEDEG
ncbi:MAG: NusG domain II-containing protein [Oscillospiraceae bacterium]|nr:NusG domain II-containing protein [Oscillospiraceae bacterium]